MIYVRRVVLGMLLAVALGVSGGCTFSNLDERPTWAQKDRLLPEDPLLSKFSEERYLTVVVFGKALTPEDAVKEARLQAKERFLGIIAQQVEGSLGSGGAKGKLKGATAYEGRVRELLRGSGELALTEIEEASGWDGYDGDDQYHYGVYAVDREKATQVLLRRASDRFDRVKLLQKRLGDAALEQAERERLALEALAALVEMHVLKEQIGLFGKASKTAWIEDMSSLELSCATLVNEAGKRREAAGSEEDLREALHFYEQAAQTRPDPLLDVSIDRVSARLPCDQCKPLLASVVRLTAELHEIRARLPALAEQDEAGRLGVEAIRKSAERTQALAHPHAFIKERTRGAEDFTALELKATEAVREVGARLERRGDSSALEEALKLYEEASRHRNDQVIVGRILEVKRRLPCLECGRGKQCVRCSGARGRWTACEVCKGGQRVQTTCPACRGDGMRPCEGCGASGAVAQQCLVCVKGRAACDACGGGGTTAGGPNQGPRPCRTCEGSGQVTCRQCKGTARVEVRCPMCGGKGRFDVCRTCQGVRTIVVECTQCKGGQVWVNCEHCGGSGTCPACNGVGHRP